MALFGGKKLLNFKCVKCSNYLSVHPIKVRKDGKSVCGRCNDVESDDIRKNKIFPQILKRMKFPCQFDSNGCNRLLSFEEVKQHEDECSYNENADTEPKEAKVPNGLVDQLKCTNCNEFLNVFPVIVNEDGTINCGRCTPDNSTQQSEQFRDLHFEDILKMCPFPCQYKDVGCTVSLLWNKIEQHEKNCQFSKSSTEQCPSLSQNNCHWESNIQELAKHFSEHHVDLILPDSLVLIVNLTRDFKNNFLLRNKNELFLVNVKVQHKENKLHITVFHVTKQNNDDKYKFCIEYTTECEEKTLTSKTKAKIVQIYKPKQGEDPLGTQVFDINQLGFCKSELSKVSFKIELHRVEQNNDDEVILRKKAVMEINNFFQNNSHKKPVSPPRNSATYQETPCKWCHLSIPSGKSMVHKKICPKRKDVCQKCSSEILISDMDEHLTNCKSETKKTPVCKWCKTKINQEDIINHEEICNMRVTTCEICFKEITSKKMRDHEISCPKKKVTCRLCEFCNIKFCVSEMENHLEICKSKQNSKIELHKEEKSNNEVVLRKKKENETKNLDKDDFPKKPVPNPRNSAVIKETSCKWCYLNIMPNESTAHNKICKKRKEDQDHLINHEDVCDRRVTTCGLCFKEIPSTKMCEHEASCSKKRVTCKLCGNADISQDDLASHEEICPNKRRQCQFCNIKFCASEMKNHLETCKSKQNACKWCNENIDLKDLKYHHNSCPKKVVSCPSCSEKMASDHLKEHATSCSRQDDSRCKWCSEVIKRPSRPSSILNKVALQEHEERCQKRAAKCSWPGCVAEMPFTDLKNHEENECVKRKINCKWCSTSILHLTQDNHYLTCIKREVPCQHCSRVFIFEEIDEHQAECTQEAQAQAQAQTQAQAQAIKDDMKYKCHKCAEFGEVALDKLLQHIKENHGADLIEVNTCNHSLAVGKGLKWHMESTELGLFFCRSVCFDGGSIKFLAQLVGAPKTAGDDIRVEIRISKEETSLEMSGSCLKYGANDKWSVEITQDDFSHLIEDGKVNYTFTVNYNK